VRTKEAARPEKASVDIIPGSFKMNIRHKPKIEKLKLKNFLIPTSSLLLFYHPTILITLFYIF